MKKSKSEKEIVELVKQADRYSPSLNSIFDEIELAFDSKELLGDSGRRLVKKYLNTIPDEELKQALATTAPTGAEWYSVEDFRSGEATFEDRGGNTYKYKDYIPTKYRKNYGPSTYMVMIDWEQKDANDDPLYWFIDKNRTVDYIADLFADYTKE